jgi:beta-lactamase regulating signal transducer with metallopeptidase domain
MTNPANFLQSLGWAVLNSLWQLALLWLVYQLIIVVFSKTGPAVKSRLASSLLILGFAWFIVTFILVYTETAAGPESTIFFNAYENEAVGSWLNKILPAASVIYLTALLFPLFRFIRNYRYVQVIRQYGISRPAAEWRLFVNRIAAQMGIKKPVHIWISEWVSSPVTIGYLKPVILVPLAAINQLSTPQMEAVLLHELAHIKRYDYLLNLVLNIIRTILYFNPFAKAFVQIVEAEREKSCDELVLQFQYQGHEYAAALLSLEKLSRTQQLLVLGAAGQGKELLHRIETILGVQRKRPFSLRQFTGILTAVFYIITLNILFLIGQGVTLKARSQNQQVVAAPLADLGQARANYNQELLSELSTSEMRSFLPVADTRMRETAIPALSSLAANPGLMNVCFDESEKEAPAIQLNPEEEAMIREAVASSRKIMESTQWKAMEKNLAEVFDQKEKEELKNALRMEMNKFDWSTWEDKLRYAYDQVNWDKVNNQLNEAISMMKTDSLVKVYNNAMIQFSKTREELAALSMEGIPDSDVSLKSLTEKQRQLEKEINRLKATRNKKVVRL